MYFFLVKIRFRVFLGICMKLFNFFMKVKVPLAIMFTLFKVDANIFHQK